MPRKPLSQFKRITLPMSQRAERRIKRRAKARELWGSPSRSVLKAQVWNLISLFVRRRDGANGGRCRICKSRPIECAYHLVPQARGDSIRYDLAGIVGACNSCNFAERMNRSLYREKHIRIFGRKYIEGLETKAMKIKKYSMQDLAELRDTFKLQLKQRE